jgi:hypothetical protein
VVRVRSVGTKIKEGAISPQPWIVIIIIIVLVGRPKVCICMNRALVLWGEGNTSSAIYEDRNQHPSQDDRFHGFAMHILALSRCYELIMRVRDRPQKVWMSDSEFQEIKDMSAGVNEGPIARA